MMTEDDYLKNPWKASTALGKLYAPLIQMDIDTSIELKLFDPSYHLLKKFSSLHGLHDGLSFFCHSLNSYTGQSYSPPLGNINTKPNSFIDSIYTISRALNSRQIPQSPVSEDTHNTLSHAAKEHIFLNNDELKRVKFECDSANLSLNTMIFFKANQVLGNVISANSRCTWMVPVNIRYNSKMKFGVYSSYFLVEIDSRLSALQFQKTIKNKLKSGEQWGNYYLGRLFSSLPSKLIMQLTKNDFNTRTSGLIGSFSNLGDPSAALATNGLPNHTWVIHGIVRKQRPIEITLCEWHGRLGIGLQFHSSLKNYKNNVTDFKNQLQQQILNFKKDTSL